MATKKIEIQDSNGDVYYPHTEASVVKNGNTTVAEQLNDLANDKMDKAKVLNNCLATEGGFALDARQGKILNDKIGNNLNNDFYKVLFKLNNKQAVKIVCVGDSITFGYNVTTPYPTILKNHMTRYFGYNDITIINSGVNGATSEYLLNNMDDLVIKHNADLIILMIGLNDIANFQTNPIKYNIDSFKSNMENIIKRINSESGQLALLTPTPCLGEDRYYQYAFIETIRQLAIKYNTKLIDIYKEFEYCISKRICNAYADIKDWQHPNDNSQQIILSSIEKSLFNILSIKETSEYPFYRSKYCRTDISNYYEDSNIWCGASYRLLKNGTSGTYLKMNFLVETKEAKLLLNCLKYGENGKFNIKIDGVTYGVDQNSANVLYDQYQELKTVGYGFHSLEVLNSDWVSGKEQFDLISLKIEV